MASRPQDWIVAASCCEGPRPRVTFSDMPRRYQRDVLSIAFAAAISSAYFLTLGMLTQPLASRSLPPRMLTPASVVARGPLFAGDSTPPIAPPRTIVPRARISRSRVPHPLASAQLAVMIEARDRDSRPVSVERRPNFLGRIFRGVLHRSVQPPGPKLDRSEVTSGATSQIAAR